MHLRLFVFLSIYLISCRAAPPKRPSSQEIHKAQKNAEEAYEAYAQQENALYKYLQEIVSYLEGDSNFVEIARNMPEKDIREGKIADALDIVGPHIHDQLKLVKARELDRIRMEISNQIELDGGAHNIKLPQHIDISSEKFTKEDLRKLIKMTLEEIGEVEENREKAFKEYEMQKAAELHHKMANLSQEEREKLEKELAEREERIDSVKDVNHPGGQDQLKEVWEEQDHMKKDDFDGRTFFMLHDLDGDGFWNNEELISLLQNELDKLYNLSDPNTDRIEREEEMNRMRHHVQDQMDKDKDGLISLKEFLTDPEAQGEEKNDSWKDLHDEPFYTDEELKKFESEYQKAQGWSDSALTTTPINNVNHG